MLLEYPSVKNHIQGVPLILFRPCTASHLRATSGWVEQGMDRAGEKGRYDGLIMVNNGK